MKTWEVKIEVLAKGTAMIEADTPEEAAEEAQLAGTDGRTGNFTLDGYDETTLEVVAVKESAF
jgi:hypothetical protein